MDQTLVSFTSIPFVWFTVEKLQTCQLIIHFELQEPELRGKTKLPSTWIQSQNKDSDHLISISLTDIRSIY